ncbi:MAG TPA: NAD(P)-dependent oxidoreductase [Candidatus Moranbacteria bacterium]|nr:NAD(P)-dependent oxidoreductase [Candidatus Moranbacteria bacterium]
MKNILIIGAKGMLGQELVRCFADKAKYKLTAWDVEEIDITDEKQVASKLASFPVDVIFNAAAYNAVDKCETDKAELAKAKKLNSLAPGYLAKAARKAGAILVHYSTDYVFSGMPDIPEPEGCTGSCGSCSLHDGFIPELGFKESDIPEPVQNYGKTKLAGEDAVQKYGEKYYIIRLSKLFGKKALAEGAKRSFFDIMLEAGKNNTQVKAVDEETSCFTYAPDLANKSKEIVELEIPYGIYHVTNSGAATWYEAVAELYKQAGIKTKIIPVGAEEFPRPAQRPYVSTLINTKLMPLRSWQDALGEYLKG